jgi:esterase
MKLHYRSYGSGPPLLVLHGLLGSLGNWHTFSKRIGEHFEVFALDLRNHGASPHDRDCSYGAMAGDVEEFLADRGVAAAHFLGHSMGGKAAMEFALRHPAKVRKLIVVDIAPKAYAPHDEAILEAMGEIDLSRYQSREQVGRALQARIPERRVREFLLTNLRRKGGGGYRWRVNLEALRAHSEEFYHEQRSLHPFPGPTLFVAGGRSALLVESDRPALLHLFPQARLITIPGAGHWVHADAPRAFLEAVLDFLFQSPPS